MVIKTIKLIVEIKYYETLLTNGDKAVYQTYKYSLVHIIIYTPNKKGSISCVPGKYYWISEEKVIN